MEVWPSHLSRNSLESTELQAPLRPQIAGLFIDLDTGLQTTGER